MPLWPEQAPCEVLASLKVPSLHSNVIPLGGLVAFVLDAVSFVSLAFATVLVLVALVFVVVVVELVVVVEFPAAFETVFDIVLVVVVFDVALVPLLALFAGALLAPPPHAIAKRAVLIKVIISLFFIYFLAASFERSFCLNLCECLGASAFPESKF